MAGKPMRKERALLAEKVKLCPTKTQEAILWQLSNAARQVYNWALDGCNEHHAETGKHKGYLSMSRELTEYKKRHPEAKFLYSKVAQNAVRRLDAGFRSFFALRRRGEKTARPPRFRSRKYFFTLEYNQSGFNVDDDKITLNFNKSDDINLHYKARPEFYKRGKTITAVQISQDRVTKQYYASIVYRTARPEPANTKAIAFDPGVKVLLTGFDGKKVVRYPSKPITTRMKYFGKQIDRVQSKIDAKKEGSKNKEKLTLVKHKLLRKRNAQINQILHSYANHITKRYGKIVVGDWHKKGTVSKDPAKGRGNKRINRIVQQIPISKLVGYLAYSGAEVTKVDESKTTRQCCNCGYTRKNHVLPEIRTLKCPECGIVIDRDANASINIYNRHLADVTRPGSFPKKLQCRSWSYAFDGHRLTNLREKPLTFPKGSPALQGGEDVTCVAIPNVAMLKKSFFE